MRTETYRPYWADLRRPEDVVQSVRDRRPSNPPAGMLDMRADLVDGCGPAAGFYSFFLDDAMCWLPDDVIKQGHEDMYEAMREAGMRSLEDFARRLIPVIQAIEKFVGRD